MALSITPCLQVDLFFQNRTKVLQISCPDINSMTNPDKLQLHSKNYSCKIHMQYQKNLSQNFDDSTSICQIHQTFHCQSFMLYGIATIKDYTIVKCYCM